jgi:HEAT repeat protein
MFPLLVAAVLAATPPAPTGAELRARVDSFLRTIHAPIPPAGWRRLGPEAVPLLEAIVRSTEELPTRRAGAVWALVHLEGAAARPVLDAMLKDREAPFVVRSAAVGGIGATVPAVELRAALAPALAAAEDVRLRARAVSVLASSNGECEAVRALVASEPEPSRPFFADAAQRCTR